MSLNLVEIIHNTAVRLHGPLRSMLENCIIMEDNVVNMHAEKEHRGPRGVVLMYPPQYAALYVEPLVNQMIDAVYVTLRSLGGKAEDYAIICESPEWCAEINAERAARGIAAIQQVTP